VGNDVNYNEFTRWEGIESMNAQLILLGRVVLAAALCGAIGIERELHGRPAGLRTHLLVGTGAALLMVSVEALLQLIEGTGTPIQGYQIDPSRLAAGIVTGIGFLGAGTIIRVGDWVRGLTTAASIWFVASIGILAGQGLTILALGGTIIGVVILFLINLVEHRIPSKVHRTLVVTAEPKRRDTLEKEIRGLCRSHRIGAWLSSWKLDRETKEAVMTYRVNYWGTVDITAFADSLAALEGVNSVNVEA
jgi:putative Mg2+ transporter-C (MgtC) family protein